MTREVQQAKGSKNNIATKLVLIAVLMFGFGYALVPLYDAFCKVTGFGGKTDIIEQVTADSAEIEDRVVTVSFTAHSNTSLPWEFRPITKTVDVKVGETQEALFYVKNKSNKPMVGMATFNVTPPRAGFHFKKTECFCFTQQRLEGGEEQEMAVRFMLDTELPDDVHELTLSYTFFNNEKYANN